MNSKKRSWISSLIIIAILAIGYYIYKNSHLVSENYEYYVYYPDIHGLLPSDPVFLKGAKVGRVSDIEYRGQKNILVTMSIYQTVPIQERTVAQLSASGLQGSKHINLIIDSTAKNILPHESELIAQYDTNVIETSSLINPMLASAKYYVRSLDSSLSNINREMHNGFGKKMKNDIVKLRNDLNTFAQSTNQLKQDAYSIANQLESFKNSSDSLAASIDSISTSIEGVDKTLIQTSKTTIKNDLKTLSKNIRGFTKAIKEVKKDSSFNQLLSDKERYSTTSSAIDTVNQKLKEVKENPKPITIIGN